MRAGQKVWLVKYALTNGISEEVAQRVSDDGWIYIEGGNWISYKVGRDVFADYGEAVKAADALRQKKLDSLRKQIEKLESSSSNPSLSSYRQGKPPGLDNLRKGARNTVGHTEINACGDTSSGCALGPGTHRSDSFRLDAGVSAVGISGLQAGEDVNKRRWTCSCGAEHDRDVNAAKNIARFGLESLAVGAPA